VIAAKPLLRAFKAAALKPTIVVDLESPAFYIPFAPDYRAVSTVARLYAAGYYMVIITDRPGSMLDVTRTWLAKTGIVYDELVIGKEIKDQVAGQYGNPRKMLLARQGVDVWVPRHAWTPMDLGLPFTFVFDDWSEVTGRLLEA
jgi:hypothetical protein